MKLTAVIRCAVPYTGMILSTRESPEMRQKVFELGVSQISAGSKTDPGGYVRSEEDSPGKEQFLLNDTRSTGEIISSVVRQGFIPSFCTGCYRLGRVGEDFMDLAKPGLIKLHCLPNALTTFKEYLVDYVKQGNTIFLSLHNGNERISTKFRIPFEQNTMQKIESILQS